ncbi:MAG: serine/threonine protein kinase, partial [Acidobacteria bacterium]|nr:serine/threonine protein kinase [Acidobacteriota bacterium]
HYNLLEKIGEGGLGEVFRARDTRAGRTVALKVLPPAEDDGVRQALLEDARAAATLSHPNIATLWDVGVEEDGTHYLAYEFVAGIMLNQEIGGRPIHARRAVELAVQMSEALADAHARGLIHGDVRPDTIAVTQKGSAKLLDFGMSRWTRGGAARTRAAAAPGALSAEVLPIVGYLSPEQALGGLVDIRTDVFSLGVVLYEMLTGRNPFLSQSAEATIVSIISTAPPPPSSLNAEVPQDVDAIVLRALAKDIDGRHQSAASLSAELRSVSAILEVRAGETSSAELMPLDDDEGGAGKYILLALVFLLVAGATWWFLS